MFLGTSEHTVHASLLVLSGPLRVNRDGHSGESDPFKMNGVFPQVVTAKGTGALQGARPGQAPWHIRQNFGNPGQRRGRPDGAVGGLQAEGTRRLPPDSPFRSPKSRLHAGVAD